MGDLSYRAVPMTCGQFFPLLRALGVIVFIIVVARSGPSEIWRYLATAESRLLLLGVIFQIGVLISKALRWHVLLRVGDSEGSLLDHAGQCLESYAIGVITPGRVGELLKLGHATRSWRSTWRSGLSALAERSVDTGLFIVAAGAGILASVVQQIPSWIGAGVSLAGVAVAILGLLLLSSENVAKRVTRAIATVPRLRHLADVSLRPAGSGATTAVLLLSVIGSFLYFLSCFFLASSVGLSITFLFTTGAVALAGLLNLLPITVMGLGTREMTFLFIFGDFSTPQVLAFSGMVFLVAQLGGGVMALIIGELALASSRIMRRQQRNRKEEK